LGCVPLAGYGLPGTPELIEPMLPLIPKYDALMMGNHGAVCYGEDVYKAFFRMETVEHFARITLVAELLGGPRCSKGEVQKLVDARSVTSEGGIHRRAACPVRPKRWPAAGAVERVARGADRAGEQALRARGIS